MKRPFSYMVSMLLSAAAPCVFETVFFGWCCDTHGACFAVGSTVAVTMMKIYDVLVLSIAWKKSREAAGK